MFTINLSAYTEKFKWAICPPSFLKFWKIWKTHNLRSKGPINDKKESAPQEEEMNETEALLKLCQTRDVEAIKGLFCSDCKIVHNNLPFHVLVLIIFLVGMVGYLLAKSSRIQNV